MEAKIGGKTFYSEKTIIRTQRKVILWMEYFRKPDIRTQAFHGDRISKQVPSTFISAHSESVSHFLDLL